ncbi:hypothetical protein V3851_16680 [Paenibacillus sp. M1]|uniref:Uncharacterized protein n=1 Tax=Paenibacillus haidiansis TaxID=1574488 RepID=A0ABU7VUL9_9BACL
MSLAEEVGGLAAIIAAKFPGAAVHRFQEPPVPAAGEFAVTLKQEARRKEARSHTLVERQYGVLCYAGGAEEAILAMETLSRGVMNEAMDGGPASPAAVRAESFTIDSLERLDSGLYRCGGTLLIHSRETVALAEYEKIGKVEMRTTILVKGGMQ